MKAVPLTIHWHDGNQPIYSAHFEFGGKGRLATAGGDNNVRLWKIEGEDEKKVTYLSTLVKHTQAVNVVRWCPKGEMLASAGDDGNVILWVPAEPGAKVLAMGDENYDDKETWRLKHMCRSMGAEIYDLAWSPDGAFFITGSMDNVARVWNTQTGGCVRQIAEHNHYVQGVAWDPLGEFLATQSSDRSVHIYSLKTKDGQFSLSQHGKISRMDLPARKVSDSPAPPDNAPRSQMTEQSPIPSAPGTPTSSFSLPMNPPAIGASRRSSFSSSRRSASPAPSMPLPAIRPMESSPRVQTLGARNANIYYNETLTSFFRRLTFTPDGSLLITPAGQYKVTHAQSEGGKDEIINTVYIYSRAGLNRPPICHLPGHKKPSVAVRCSPKYYQLRNAPAQTRHFTIDTAGDADASLTLPPPAITNRPAPTSASSSMVPPSPSPSVTSNGGRESAKPPPTPPPTSTFSLPYRMVYAVATQDSVFIYDTQSNTPLCVVTNLHYAAFTDLAWSPDGLTLLITSSDGYCSAVLFSTGELGEEHPGPNGSLKRSSAASGSAPSHRNDPSPASLAPPPSPTPSSVSVVPPTQSGMIQINDPIPTLSNVPSVVAASSTPAPPPRAKSPLPPGPPLAAPAQPKREVTSTVAAQEGEKLEEGDKKRRRVAPTLVASIGDAPPTSK